MSEEELAAEMAELVYKRTQLVYSDAEDLAWDLLNLIEGEE
ncbi:hypothetical protein SEA_DANFORTH_77 [Mycobacterium phage Danforth]|uniref:Uncharacterized protein n=1 Tax=Mycobacterium phage Saintus TaxID=2923007 RepID=G8IRF5_9CAUD|nr:hypothetical protein FGG39_gp30 [Mycobacterium phage Saintus]AER26455.1 hypothetical protein SAINTUS_72 [Mycobacterium phage Saintus]QJD50180.1 hypothetical protein SEA_DANFORTH_77 [Mycobacterium phage Danforth]